MSGKTGIQSNGALTPHSLQSRWASAPLCRETSADCATGAKQIWPVSWTACRLSGLAASVMPVVAMSNHTAALQIPIGS